MGKDIRIGQAEFFSLFVMARMFGALAFEGDGRAPIYTSTALLGQLAAAGVMYIVLARIVRLVRLSGADTPLGLCFLPGRSFGRAAALVLGACSFVTVLHVSGSLGYYFSSIAYPKASVAYFVVLFLAAAVYFCHMGLEAVSRLSNLLVAGFLVVLCLLVAGLWRAAELMELVSPFYEGPNALGSSIYHSLVDWSDVFIMAMMAPTVNGGIRKPARYVFALALLATGLITFLLITVFGEYGAMRLFPVQSLFAAAELWVPARVDFLFMLVVLASGLVKAALHLSFVSFCVKTLMPQAEERWSHIVLALAAGGLVLALHYSAILGEYFKRFVDSGATVLVTTLIIPPLAFLLRRRKGGTSA